MFFKASLTCVRTTPKTFCSSEARLFPWHEVSRLSCGECRFVGPHCLDAIDLDVAPSEIVALIGPNGAGKTSLFNCISGDTALHVAVSGSRP
jgi:ABC-type molybdenum transport system ATPase subunit/photorepair protein PhrA